MDQTLKNISYVEINLKRKVQIIMKVTYFEWDLKTQIYSTEDKMKDVTACLLLPNLSHETEKIFYCCIRKDQKVLQQDGFNFIGLQSIPWLLIQYIGKWVLNFCFGSYFILLVILITNLRQFTSRT